jgi:tetratricopeptide (TPR) repeat protein
MRPADAMMSKDQAYSLFSQANQSFREANSAKNPEQAKKLYEKAILAFKRIINEGRIKNARLYYNLANAYFLKGDIGKAILNYRRAEKLDNSDANIQKNLTFFWHYDFSIKAKFLFTCIFFGVVCICVAGIIWFGRSAPWMVPAVICAILTTCFLISLVVESGTKAGRICGVITIKEVVAHQGDGQNYAPSFKEPLHEGTEFDLLESRPGWLHIELTDNSDAWIPQISADLI